MQATVRTVSQRVYSNRSQFIDNPNPKGEDDLYLEIQDINESRLMQVDIYSRNNDARERFWEVEMALKSNYAQYQMDLYNFKIGTIPNAQNLSGLDGGSDINRYTISFNVLTHQHKETPISYYDKFKATLNNEEGKFAEITSEGYED